MRTPARGRAISPVIAEVILVAVAIAISIAVAGWLFGLWGLYTSSPEIRVIGVEATLNSPTLEVDLLVSNTGTASDTLMTALVIVAGKSVEATIMYNNTTYTTLDIPAGFQGTITLEADLSGTGINASPGDPVIAKTVFKNTGAQQTTLIIRG